MRNIPLGITIIFAVALGAAAGLVPGGAAAQDKPTLGADDYDRWESLGQASLSPDGLWLAVVVRRVDETSELRVHRTDSDSVVIVAEGSRPEFSADGNWLAHAIGVSPDERERLGERGDPVRNGVGLLDLRTGEREETEAMQSFSFSDDGRYLALRRYGPEESESDGADVLVRDLTGGGSMSFGNVAEFAWQEDGSLLAMTVDAEDRIGNGVRLYDPDSGRIRSLDADEATYRELSWRDDAPDLAVLKTFEDELHEDTAHVALAWRDLDSGSPRAFALDPREPSELPGGTRIVEHRVPSWSDDGSTIFLGLQERIPVETAAEDAEGEGEGEDGEAAEDENGPERDDDESPGVEVWHSLDVDPIPQQRVREDRLRREHDLGAWNLADGGFLLLGGDHADQVEIAQGGRHVLARDETPYDVDAMFRQQFHDLYAVDARTGRRELVRERINVGGGSSPGGRYVAWFEGEDYWTHDLTTGETRNVTSGLDGTFVDLDRTPTREQMPPFGFVGWLDDDAALLVNDRFDVWEVNPDGSGGRRLTNGTEGSVRHRVVRVDRDADAFAPDEPLYYSTYAEWTKKAGFSRARRGETPEPLIWADASFAGGLLKAEDADVYAFRRERFDDSPDYFVAGPDLDEARQVTRTNPFQEDYAWGRTQLIDYENEWGRPLQGALVYPADYDPDRTYPMIVYHYELLSQSLHRYVVPDPTRYYNIQIWSQEGYFVFQPDIVYRDRRPGQSNVETLRPAVAAAVETGMIDADRVGLIGHSWGGYQTTFFVTQDDLFAAAVAGAPLTNLMSMYLSFYWNSGGTDARIFEISQGRMQVPWWEDWDSYFNNSPLHHIQNLNTPLLMEFGTEDGAVEFNQGVEFYNAARRAGKHMVMLVYEGENHGLAREPNQRDYQSRILQWFAHYLKGEPAPEWITTGVPWLEQKDGLKKKKVS
ncbi:prolyl oligopeptidase family serine peptidase [Candidatus Palauibacter soopunensis]|uniref:S9 family peptidase n=1 Tax=Candidatus Palauibacter soopunensis TaxID=3056739 RepID=UPI00239D8649|nr:prolyl oligopeptidase family serine peptidase [Candidatus Palauibacter soopunensis]MDE2879098.1 prolyl oligopeptidase family serine peptidase [Candidatus Palauibacter soopunensis]